MRILHVYNDSDNGRTFLAVYRIVLRCKKHIIVKNPEERGSTLKVRSVFLHPVLVFGYHGDSNIENMWQQTVSCKQSDIKCHEWFIVMHLGTCCVTSRDFWDSLLGSLQGGALVLLIHHMYTRLCWPGVNLTHNSSNTLKKSTKASTTWTSTTSHVLATGFSVLCTLNPSWVSRPRPVVRHRSYLQGAFKFKSVVSGGTCFLFSLLLWRFRSYLQSLISKFGTRK